ncbi:nuclear transport factor 2 family protein [Crossiella cryophila]|uniref:Ketosteroid isomerase-like protein n=1 Tax=Crossiella cryophila TaxID=43355 RepID=A0A7W7CCI8_9PSEU|nr:nuclear transport factor 2 family protein [Crossiella cryophila]MBB4678512.1 ketosteroid isomerase-like protein [Crossiella cryophila]
MATTDTADYTALDPFFGVIQRGLDGLADGAHFFDLFAADAVTEYVVTIPGYPRRVDSRAALMALYAGYGDGIRLHWAGDLAVHQDREAGVVVLEYGVAGKIVATGADYANRFVSIITIRDRKITHWRDYLDSYAAMRAVGNGAPAPE